MNNQKLNQPHIKKRIQDSGGMETAERAKIRTQVIAMLENHWWTIGEQLDDMSNIPMNYIHWDLDSRISLGLFKAWEKWILWPKSIHRKSIESLRLKLNKASVAIWTAQVEYAMTQWDIWRIVYTTRWRVKQILWQTEVQ